MSYSYVLSGERSSSGTAKRWLFAYPLAQLFCLGTAAGAAVLSSRLTSLDVSYVTLATSVAVAMVYGLTFGYLRGCVLRDKLARFSMPAWCAAIAAVSVFFLPPAPEALPALSGAMSNLQAAAIAALPVALSGFVYGLAIGAAEAFSLRRAASVCSAGRSFPASPGDLAKSQHRRSRDWPCLCNSRRFRPARCKPPA
jgi:hypothetical protein